MIKPVECEIAGTHWKLENSIVQEVVDYARSIPTTDVRPYMVQFLRSRLAERDPRILWTSIEDERVKQ